MSYQGTQAIQEIKARLNIVDIIGQYVNLRRNGSRWVAPCPFHQETKPSFSVTEEGFFYCFGCQVSGDIFTFYGQINGLNFRESLEQLAEIAGVKIEKFDGIKNNAISDVTNKRQLLKIYAFTSKHFFNNLKCEIGSECQEYILQRGLSEEVRQQFSLGWSSREWDQLLCSLRRAGFDEKLCLEAGVLFKSSSGRVYDRFRNRLMFPIESLSGDVIAFGGRIIKDEEEAKYINSNESPLYKKGNHLYGLQQARKSISAGKPALLTEGYMDVITLHQYGYTNAVGVLGTSLTLEQVKRISCFTSNVDILFDADRAGYKAALRACEMFLTRGLNCRVLSLPEGEDVDSYIRIQGKESFDSLYKNAPLGINFCIQALRGMAPRDIIDWVRNFLKQIEWPELVSRFASMLCTGLGLSESELREHVALSQSGRDKHHFVTKQSGLQTELLVDKQIMMFLVRYPHTLKRLQDIGALVVLKTSWAKKLWEKLAIYTMDEVIHHLTPEEKNFWINCRTGDVPPQNNEEGEFKAIQSMLEILHITTQSASVSAALQGRSNPSGFEADLEYLRALQETLERTHGE